MEWLIISLAILLVLILGGVGYVIDKGRKVKRLTDKPEVAPRLDKKSDRGSTPDGTGTATKTRPGTKATGTKPTSKPGTKPATKTTGKPTSTKPTSTKPSTTKPGTKPTPTKPPTTPTPPVTDSAASTTADEATVDGTTVDETTANEATVDGTTVDETTTADPAATNAVDDSSTIEVPDSPAGINDTIAPPEPELEAEPEPEPEPELDTPPSTVGRMGRLRDRLARSNSAFGRGLLAVISKDEMTEDDWEDLEDSLLQADVGVAAATHIVEQLRTKSMVEGARSSEQIKALLAAELTEALGADWDRSLTTNRDDGPAVVMVVGVNGTGKTTTCGKLARVLVGDGNTVLMGAADTFRAAAADQLATWGERVGVDVVRGPEGADPASVAFDAVKAGKAQGIDTVLVDTAGRLHTKSGLMDELGKVKRVIEKQGPVDETLLVLDATTGQNGLVQARVFTDVVDVTGVVLTKLDGSAKGGIVIAVQNELGVPVKYVGIGEGKDDLAPFVPEEFVDGLLQTGS
ncbi:signal recognition particle-docking protein FtsY [Epidermidibacterium keratini]|uniref:Signal recognition particle receptor FtsY n=1 Tax=Epidermidibacterium keratini TaxID=1891644 RepID=A0A7L4YRQ2_9ACTN|nr:signal recognition particle-docking protein FtsY [Epidermidibacterium keratini]QHC01826.1 signal recognition particle-docking protein FtsY [Epidermidibacterium keratini]